MCLFLKAILFYEMIHNTFYNTLGSYIYISFQTSILFYSKTCTYKREWLGNNVLFRFVYASLYTANHDLSRLNFFLLADRMLSGMKLVLNINICKCLVLYLNKYE